ncbi:MAG: phosphohydrolase [Rhodospirillaceae bacterium]|nr:phosphohydrolase [Rhodospirillaceae bacterium]
MSTVNEGTLREGALEIVRVLRDAGYQALWVGGCVRDDLLGIPPKDYDIATDVDPEAVLDLFASHEGSEARFVGEAFGVVRVSLSCGVYEVARFREEGDYQDGRHPSSVRASTAERDALRRDFTVNGMFYDPIDERVIDYVGGQADLDAKVIRTIGEPSERFGEDHLRMLRAIRFASRLNWPIQDETFSAIVDLADQITRISQERVRDELILILTEGGAPQGIRSLIDTGLAGHLLPEILDMDGVSQPPQFHPEGDVLTHTMIMLGLLRDPNLELAFGVLLHDVGKPSTYEVLDRIRFNNHVKVGAEMAEAICRRLRMSNDQTEHIRRLVADHHRFASVHEMRQSTLKRFLRTPRFEDHLELHRLDCLSSHRKLESYRFSRDALGTLKPDEIRPDRLITGDDLIAAGYPPGPAFKLALGAVEEQQLEGKLETAEAALAVATAILDQDASGS